LRANLIHCGNHRQNANFKKWLSGGRSATKGIILDRKILCGRQLIEMRFGRRQMEG
jgi:hypothetical protein